MARALRSGRAVAGTVAGMLGTAALLTLFAGAASASQAPETALHHAAEKVLAEKSAQESMRLNIAAAGTTVTVFKLVGTQTFAAPLLGSFTETVLSGSTGQTTRLPFLIDGTAVYIKKDRTWYSVTAQQILSEEGLSGSLQSSGNPAEVLALLYQSGAKVTDLGNHRLDGATMTEYHTSADPAKGFKPPSGLSYTPKGLAMYKELTGGKPLSVDVWVDGSGVLRQEQIHIPLSKAAVKKFGLSTVPGISMTMTVGLSDFGVPVSVTPPATAKPLNVSGGTQA